MIVQFLDLYSHYIASSHKSFFRYLNDKDKTESPHPMTQDSVVLNVSVHQARRRSS